MSVKRVLMLCYYYPPQGGVGCVRSVGFSSHLHEHGWAPTVLSVSNPFKPMMPVTGEPVPDGVDVRYARNWFNYPVLVEAALRRLGVTDRALVPDPWFCWIPGAIIAGRRMIDTGTFDAIYVSCPPFSASLAASYLADKGKIPLVVDLRDAWTQNPYAGEYLFDGLDEIDEGFEREMVRSASVVIGATDGIVDSYRRLYPNIAEKFVCILNGFDPETVPTYRVSGMPNAGPCVILYAGSFYGNRTPSTLFTALASLLKSGRITSDDVQFKWIGRPAPHVIALADALGIAPLVEYGGMQTKCNADAELVNADLLYLTIAPTNEPVNTTMTGKIYPYIASGTPILATVPEGDAADLIRTWSPGSTVVTDGDETAIATAILAAIDRHRGGHHRNSATPETDAFRSSFSYAARTAELAAILDRVSARGVV
jgi:hypothetical protein